MYFLTIIVVAVQLVVGQLLGFGVAYYAGIGNGWELFVIPLGNILGVWGIGTIASWLRREVSIRSSLIQLGGTAVGGAIGLILIVLTPPTGMNQVIYPLIGALLGYYLASRFFPSK
jgi:hypothetical protein